MFALGLTQVSGWLRWADSWRVVLEPQLQKCFKSPPKRVTHLKRVLRAHVSLKVRRRPRSALVETLSPLLYGICKAASHTPTRCCRRLLLRSHFCERPSEREKGVVADASAGRVAIPKRAPELTQHRSWS